MPWKRRLYCCPTCKRNSFFILWQRMSVRAQEHQNFPPLLFFPFGLFGLKVGNPQNILWSTSWQLKPVQTALKRRPGLPCKASTTAVTRATSWKPAATAATGQSEEEGHQQPAYEGRLVCCCAQGGAISGSHNNCQVEREDSAAEHKSKQLQKQSLFLKISTKISPSNGKHLIIITMED